MITELQLWPSDPVAKFIIFVLIALFIRWIVWWVQQVSRIRSAQQDLSKSKRASEVLLNGIATATHDGNSDVLFESFLKRALNGEDLSRDRPVGKHISTIYLSGVRNGTLDMGELNRLTAGETLKWEPVLRSLLATFVIVGLLGTLFGIAKAVAVFGGDEPSAKDLLQRLPGAFTPSIWGVGLSIVGSLMLVYIRSKASLFSINLRSATMEVLIPRLMPSRAEQFDRSVRRTMDAAEKVVQFAESIEERSGELDGALRNAASYALTISEAMETMSENIGSASSVVDATFATLNARIKAISETLQQFGGHLEAMEMHETRVIGLLQHFVQLGERNTVVSEQTKQFLLSGTSDLLSAAREMYKPVKDSADEITKTSNLFAQVLSDITEKQTGVLETQFTTWRSELSQGAETAKRSLDNLKEPFERSAENLRDQAAGSIVQMSTLISELKTNGSSLNSKLDDVIGALRELASREGGAGKTDKTDRDSSQRYRNSESSEGARQSSARTYEGLDSDGAKKGTDGSYDKIDAGFRSLDSRLGGLEAAIRDFADATRPKTSIFRRFFNHKS